MNAITQYNIIYLDGATLSIIPVQNVSHSKKLNMNRKPKIRIPLPKQKEKTFKSPKDYTRKPKHKKPHHENI